MWYSFSMKKLDLTGQKFGKWEAIKPGAKPSYWLCKCECGNEVEVFIGSLRNGKSLGCLRCQSKWMSESGQASKNATIHGMHKSYTYNSWKAMKERCTNPNHDQYEYYGGAGTTVCDQWFNSFQQFYDDMGERPEDCTLDRIDVNGNYEPGNCRWATVEEQNRNKTNTIYVIWENNKIALRDLYMQLDLNSKGIPYGTLYAKVRNGETVENILKKKERI